MSEFTEIIQNIINKELDAIDKRANLIKLIQPKWSWLNDNTFSESLENDKYINSYTKFLSNKIISELKKHFSKQELQILTDTSYDNLKDISLPFDKRFPNNIVEIDAFDEFGKNFDLIIINFQKIKSNALQSIHYYMPKNIILLDLYILNDDNTLNTVKLKKILFDIQNLSHELTHVIDINRVNNATLKIAKSTNAAKYNKFNAYYCNNPYEYHAFTNQIITALESIWDKDSSKVVDLIKCRDINVFFDKLKSLMNDNFDYIKYLNKRNKKNTVSRICNYFYDKAYKEGLIEKPVYHEKVEFDYNKNEILFDIEDLPLYNNLLIECLKENA